MISTKNDRHCWYLTSGNESSFNKTNLDLHCSWLRILKRHHVVPFYIPSDLFFWNPFWKLFVKHPKTHPIQSWSERGSGTWSGTQFEGCGLRLPTGSHKTPDPGDGKKRPETKSAGFGTETFVCFFVWKSIYIVRLEVVACKGKEPTAVFFELYRSDIEMM